MHITYLFVHSKLFTHLYYFKIRVTSDDHRYCLTLCYIYPPPPLNTKRGEGVVAHRGSNHFVYHKILFTAMLAIAVNTFFFGQLTQDCCFYSVQFCRITLTFFSLLQTRNGCRLVSLASWLRLLALRS